MDLSFRPVGTVTADGRVVILTIDYTCTLPEEEGTTLNSEVAAWLAQPAQPNQVLGDNQAGGFLQEYWFLTCDGTPQTIDARFDASRGTFHAGRAVAYRFFSEEGLFPADPVYVRLRWER